jgi:hypothetical protein
MYLPKNNYLNIIKPLNFDKSITHESKLSPDLHIELLHVNGFGIEDNNLLKHATIEVVIPESENIIIKKYLI